MIVALLLVAQTLTPLIQNVNITQGFYNADFILQDRVGSQYLMLASLTGITPGIYIPPINITIPIVYDILTEQILLGLRPEFIMFGTFQYITVPNGAQPLHILFPPILGLVGIQIYVAGYINSIAGYFPVGPCIVQLV